MARWTGLFPPGKGSADGVPYGGKGKFFLYTLLLKAQECLYPINRTTPANGSETDQVIPLLDSVKVKTNKRGRPRKSLKVKVLTADKAYVRF